MEKKEKKIKRLQFCYINEDYAGFLRSKYDKRVPNIKGEDYRHDKFFIGVLLKINNYDYFAPISSYRQENAMTFSIKDTEGRPMASVRTNYMFPIIKGVSRPLLISKFKGSYKYFLQEEFRYCNNHRTEICEMAKNMYFKKTKYNYKNAEERKMYQAMCCDFTRLERGAKSYQDKYSGGMPEEDKRLLDKYPIDADKLSQIKKVREGLIKDGGNITIENCIRMNIKFAPEVYGKEWSDQIAREDRQAKQQRNQAKPQIKTQEKIKPKPKAETQKKLKPRGK